MEWHSDFTQAKVEALINDVDKELWGKEGLIRIGKEFFELSKKPQGIQDDKWRQ